ncbi:hypothetical protein JCM31598_33450 [Desulfonatronum parangueonense]
MQFVAEAGRRVYASQKFLDAFVPPDASSDLFKNKLATWRNGCGMNDFRINQPSESGKTNNQILP